MPRTPTIPLEPFTPVPMRPRTDGWSAARQTGFVEALAATANVQAAAKAVGMSAAAAYALRARPEAASFREAWALALDYAVHRLGEAALDRALRGTATPIFFQGEQVGERRRYDEKLTMFILKLRDPQRHGGWRETATPWHSPDQAAALLHAALARTATDGHAADTGRHERQRPPLPLPQLLSSREAEALRLALAEQRIAAAEAAEEARQARARDEEFERYCAEPYPDAAAAPTPPAPPAANMLGDNDDDDDDNYDFADDDTWVSGEEAISPDSPSEVDESRGT